MTNQWDQYADLYDTGIGNAGDTLHTSLIDPLIFSYTGDVSSKSVIDLGCGNGYLADKLNAKSYIGIDSSAELIKKAGIRHRNIPAIRFIKADISKSLPQTITPSDTVIANMVLQYVDDLSLVSRIIPGLLVTGGAFIAVVDHPAHALFVRAQALAGKHDDKFIDNSSYFNEGIRRKNSLWGKAVLTYYHHTIASYVNASTGILRLDRMDEVSEDKEMPRIFGLKFSKR